MQTKWQRRISHLEDKIIKSSKYNIKNKNKFYKVIATEEISDPSKQHKKWKRGDNNNWYHRATKEKKVTRILWIVICQPTGQLRGNEQIFRKIQTTKIESRKNRLLE